MLLSSLTQYLPGRRASRNVPHKLLRPQVPGTGWEWYSGVVLLQPPSPVPWVEITACQGWQRPGWSSPLSWEGADAGGFIRVTVPAGSSAFPLAAPLAQRGDLLDIHGHATAAGFDIREIDRGGLEIAARTGPGGLGVVARFAPASTHRWARLPRVLSGVSVFATASVTGRLPLGEAVRPVTTNGKSAPPGFIEHWDLRGFGLVTHLWGASVPANPHWWHHGHSHATVLGFHDSADPGAGLVALAVSTNAHEWLPCGGAGGLPSFPLGLVLGLDVTYQQFSAGWPALWEGRIYNARGVFRYLARRTSLVPGVFPRGALAGFDFEGSLQPYGKGAVRRHAGSGLARMAGPF